MKPENIVTLHIKKGYSVEIESGIIFEIINLEEMLKSLNESSRSIPAPHYVFNIDYKLIIGDTEYFGKTICDTYNEFKHEFDFNSPVIARIYNWHLGKNESDPRIEIEIIDRR